MSEYIDLSAITKRLKEVVDRSELTSRDFAMKAGIAPATLSLNLNEKQQINVATINKIVEHFSDIMSPEEFVFGASGVSNDSGRDLFFASSGVKGEEKETLRAILQAQAEEIARLKAEVRERREKGIAHITVFYDDNSFATFKDTEE